VKVKQYDPKSFLKPHQIIHSSALKSERHLSEGVYKMTLTKPDGSTMLVAAKAQDYNPDMVREVNLLLSVLDKETGHPHPHIVSLLGMVKDEGLVEGKPYGMVLEFAPLGSMDHLYQKDKLGGVNSFGPLKTRIALEIAKGMKQIHSHDNVHVDVKPLNVLVFSIDVNHEGPLVKLADFGTSRTIHDPFFGLDTAAGYIPPEIVIEKFKKYGNKAKLLECGHNEPYEEYTPSPHASHLKQSYDIYGYGVSMWSLAVEIVLVKDHWKPQEIAISQGKIYTDEVNSLPGVPEAIKKIVAASLHGEATQRPTAAQLVDMLTQYQQTLPKL